MKVLIADDDKMSRMALLKNLQKWGYEVEEAKDGMEAWRVLSGESPPRLGILNWMMPEMEGVEICRRLKQNEEIPFIYTILLTGKTEKEDVVEGLDSGAHDFLSKPVHSGELRSRIAVGVRLVEAEDRLLRYAGEIELKNRELEKALADIRTLKGILPICAGCKRIRDDKGYWNQIEAYIRQHSEADFSHALCPECADKLYGNQDWYKKKRMKDRKSAGRIDSRDTNDSS